MAFSTYITAIVLTNIIFVSKFNGIYGVNDNNENFGKTKNGKRIKNENFEESGNENLIKIEPMNKIKQEPKEEDQKEMHNYSEQKSIKKIKIEQLPSTADEQEQKAVLKAEHELEQPNNMDEDKKRKWDIVNMFNRMVEEYLNKRIYKRQNLVKIECQIAKKLGTSRTKIYKLKKELKLDDGTKFAIINKFEAIKNDCKQKNLFNNKNRLRIENEIATNQLGNCRTYIFKWKKELGLSSKTPSYKTEQKFQIIKAFDLIKAELLTKLNSKKLNAELNRKYEEKIAQKFGIKAGTIYKWKWKFGLLRKMKYTDAEKIALLKKFDKIKRKNPSLIGKQIAKMLKIRLETVRRWRNKYQ